MRFDDLEKAVERNVVKLFKAFYENPAFFLCERDVECYLYSLLINDSLFKRSFPKLEDDNLKKDSKTLLVHSEMPLGIKGKTKMYDISIWKPCKAVRLDDWEEIMGIEIKFNRRFPRIIEDIKKAKESKRGYVLWLNWDREIDTKTLKKAKNFVKKYRNVKLFYLDVSSDTTKTNVRDVAEQ